LHGTNDNNTNNNSNIETDLTNNNQVNNTTDIIKPQESFENTQNNKGLVNSGRLTQVEQNTIVVKDEVSGKLSEAKIVDGTIIYKWKVDDASLVAAKVTDLQVGQKLAVSYFDENKNNEINVLTIYPPFMVTGLVDEVNESRVIVTDINESKKYTANLSATKVVKYDNSGQKIETNISDLVKGDRTVVYSDYGVEYQKSNFEAKYIEIIVKNDAPVVTPPANLQPVEQNNSNNDPADIVPPPSGINPTGTLPGVQIGN